jgi:CheY-like chemotaxis protein
VLLVDDDDGVRFVAAAALRALGHEVLEAANAAAAEALAHAEGLGGIGLLVTDVSMPGASGPELAERLRAERPDLPVVFLTGHAGAADLGDAPVLRKPFSGQDLARETARALAGGGGGG